MVKEEIRFELVPDVGKNVTVLKSVKFNESNDWHTVELDYKKGRIKLTVDYHNKHAQMFGKCHIKILASVIRFFVGIVSQIKLYFLFYILRKYFTYLRMYM